MSNEKTASTVTTSAVATPEIIWGGAPEKRWVLNAGDFNKELAGMHVRFNKVFTDAQCVAFMKDASFVREVRNINARGRADAFSATKVHMSVGVPDAQLHISSTGGSQAQNTSLPAVIEQVHGLMLRATKHEAVVKPAFNAEISGFTVGSDGKASFIMTCSNGKKFIVTAQEQK